MAKKRTRKPVQQAVDVPATIAAVRKIWDVVAAMRTAGKADLAAIMALGSAIIELVMALRAPGATLTLSQVTRAARAAGLPQLKPGQADRWLVTQAAK